MQRLILCICLAVALSGCSALTGPQQPLQNQWLLLQSGVSIGQTFVAEYDGLVSVQFMLQAFTPGEGEIHLHLRSDPHTSNDLAIASLPLSGIGGPALYGFYFEPQKASRRQSYYAFLEISGQGSVQVGCAGGDAYLDGSLYADGVPVEGQTAFQLTYARRWALLGLAREALHWGGLVALGLWLFTLPGWGLLTAVWPRWAEMRWPEKLAVSTGVSLAIYPLLFLYTDAVGLRLGALYAWLPPLAGAALIAWRNYPRYRTLSLQKLQSRIKNHHWQWPSLALLVVMTLLIVSRLWAIRSLEAPMWGDSVQHTVMAQLMLDNSGLFHSWEPYAPYDSLTVQFGFSAFTALFSWLSGLNSIKSVLVVGQWLNLAAVFTLYPLATRLGRGNAWAGVGAVLTAGLLSPMPAFYVNWGRYAQLAGQAILPTALWLVWATLDFAGHTTKRKQALVGVTLSAAAVAGMALSYYRMPFYYVTFVLALLAGWGLPTFGRDWRRWLNAAVLLSGAALLSGVFFAPWLLHISGGALADAVQAGVSKGSPTERVLEDYRVWLAVFDYVPRGLAAVALAGVGWALWRREWMTAAQALWAALLAATVAGALLRLPAANLMQTFAVLIALYMPVALAAGWLMGAAAARLGQLRRGALLASVLICAAALGGAWNQRDIAQPQVFGMVFRPDSRALAWVRENLPAEARFLVEGFRIYGGSSAVGADAGWWLPLIARRQNTMPPQYALLNERPNEPAYSRQVVELVASLETQPPAAPDTLRQMCALGVTHIYIGQAQGNASASRTTQLFAPADFADKPAFELVYHRDRVFVYALWAEACPRP